MNRCAVSSAFAVVRVGMRWTSESVDHYIYCIMALCRFGQACNKIHANTFPWFIWNGKWLKEFTRTLISSFVCLAGVACLNVFTHIFIDGRPKVMAFDQIFGFACTDVSCRRRVMAVTDDSVFELCVVGDNQSVLEIPEPIMVCEVGCDAPI